MALEDWPTVDGGAVEYFSPVLAYVEFWHVLFIGVIRCDSMAVGACLRQPALGCVVRTMWYGYAMAIVI